MTNDDDYPTPDLIIGDALVTTFSAALPVEADHDKLTATEHQQELDALRVELLASLLRAERAARGLGDILEEEDVERHGFQPWEFDAIAWQLEHLVSMVDCQLYPDLCRQARLAAGVPRW